MLAETIGEGPLLVTVQILRGTRAPINTSSIAVKRPPVPTNVCVTRMSWLQVSFLYFSPSFALLFVVSFASLPAAKVLRRTYDRVQYTRPINCRGLTRRRTGRGQATISLFNAVNNRANACLTARLPA